jgi:hypothetical protein
MVSPDRSVCFQLDDRSLYCPDYLDELQITVLASHFSQAKRSLMPHLTAVDCSTNFFDFT